MSVVVDSYLKSYENLEVHELMLRDSARLNSYRNAIAIHAECFKNRIVIDVGAGCGILSVYAAKAGARLVYAVEPTNLAEIAAHVIVDNNVSHIVQVINCTIEEFNLPKSAEKADILISEWMGFFLLHEGMLDSVLFARDNFLKTDGIMFPIEATLFIAPCELPSRFGYWNNVEGVCLNAFGSELRKQIAQQPTIMTVNPNDLLDRGRVFCWLGLTETTDEDIDEIIYSDVIKTKRAGVLQGFCIWFDCDFPGDGSESVVLSTSPACEPTHWKQTVAVLPDSRCVYLQEGSLISFQIKITRKPTNRRQYNIEIAFDDIDPEHPIPCDCDLTKCIVAKAHSEYIDSS